MNRVLFSFITVCMISGAVMADNGVVTKNVDTKKSSLKWEGKKVTGSHDGTINIKTGALLFEDGQLKGGTFSIDMTSINCLDLSGGGKEKLEGHLKSDDFFGVEKYPEAKMVVKRVVSLGTPGDYRLIADLTIKGTTKEIKFDAKVMDNAASAEIVVDRSEFNIRYGSGSFFDNLGDKTIYDDFTLNVSLVF
jgi:polyisoprenoid-binding protein YceI